MSRRRFMNQLEGFIYNASLDSMGNISNVNGCCITNFLPATRSQKIRFYHGFQNATIYDRCLVEYDSNKNHVDYWNHGGAYVREITIAENSTTWIRVTLNLDNINDCYVLNVSTGKYLWKGNNIK